MHLYLDELATVFAKEGFLAVHAKDGGEKTICLRGRAVKVTDLLSGETVAHDADAFTVRFDTPDTRLFSIEAKPCVYGVARPPRPCSKGEGALATSVFVPTSIEHSGKMEMDQRGQTRL